MFREILKFREYECRPYLQLLQTIKRKKSFLRLDALDDNSAVCSNQFLLLVECNFKRRVAVGFEKSFYVELS